MLTTFIVMRHLPNVPTGAIAIQVEKFIDVRTVYSDTPQTFWRMAESIDNKMRCGRYTISITKYMLN